jgi:prolyl 4-hydroxylase
VSAVKAKDLGSKKIAEFSKNVRRKLKKHDRVEIVGQAGLDLYCVQGFLTPEECQGIIDLIEADNHPSSLYAGTEQQGFRTSFSCNLDPYHPLVMRIERRICELMGIDHRHGETLQGQRYQPGQQFKPHHDYFHVGQSYWEPERKNGGQRTWTGMIYLNEPEGGGETNFPKAGLCVQPRTAMLVMWNNMTDIGSPQDLSIHEGCPVSAGTKYIVTKWFRERFWGGKT